MTRLAWGLVGERFYETGIDRGVLYPADDSPGVAWNGITAVRENPSGGEPRPYYIDGQKYLNISSAEEFSATLEAFSSPKEFAVCDGTVQLLAGLFATQQPRKSFGLSYRTRVGNDVNGVEHGYKIHLVYGALASASGVTYGTLSDSTEPTAFSWEITTLPPIVSGYKPTAHFVIDSRGLTAEKLTEIEDVLYGTNMVQPSLPTVPELIDILT